VTSAVSGYAGGDKNTAEYERVGTGLTGHAESVQITFDPRVVTYGRILQIFFSVAHDPTELNQQGPDVGPQYRSTVFPATPEQESRIWLGYLYARAAFAVSESSGVPVAGEHDATFEEELRGRIIAVNTFRELKRKGALLASGYFSDIDRVDAAGFLREYVWSYLKRDSWKTAPPNLDMQAFNQWRATNLAADHVGVTHGRIAFKGS